MPLIHDEDLQVTSNAWSGIVQGIPTTVEMRWKAAPGTLGAKQTLVDGVQWVLSACVPIYDHAGKLVSVSGNCVDISAQKREQGHIQQRAIALDKLEDGSQRFVRFSESAPIGIFIFGRDRKIQYCDSKFFELTGHTQVPQREFDWLSIMNDDEFETIDAAWNRCFEHGEQASSAVKLRTREYVSPDGQGSNAYIQTLAIPDVDANGVVTSVTGCILDISHFKWVEDLQRVRIEEAMKAKRQQENFIDTTSHEMRNPLSAMLQCCDMATDSANELHRILGEESSSNVDPGTMAMLGVRNTLEALSTIQNCAIHQKRIIDDILTLSKLDSSLIETNAESVRPADIIKKAITMFAVECAKLEISLKAEIDDSLQGLRVEWCMLDEFRLLQILINLITNAIKFTQGCPQRSITITLSAYTTPPSDQWSQSGYIAPSLGDVPINSINDAKWGKGNKTYLCFSVMDTGCGIAPELQTQLFNRFKQAGPRTHVQYGGSGLGLFISKRLIELQGGHIGIKSDTDKGSNFAFFIQTRCAPPPDVKFVPRSMVSPPRSSTSSIPQTPSTRSATSEMSDGFPFPLAQTPAEIFKTRGYSALVVEDNLTNQRVLAQQLRKAGCTVHVAGNGQIALDFIRTTSLALHTTLSTTPSSDDVASAIPLDIILMDVEMPIMDGLTATREIRKLEADGSLRDRIPILTVSANARPEQVQCALDAGMDDAISKPFRVVDLIPKVLELLEATW